LCLVIIGSLVTGYCWFTRIESYRRIQSRQIISESGQSGIQQKIKD
jgi:hypothetical protein